MRFYLAHNYAAKEWLKENIVPILEREGHMVTSRWLHQTEAPHGERASYALRDLEDIHRADHLLLFGNNFGERPGRGKYFEFGYAYSNGKLISVIGEQRECCFYELPGVSIHPTFDDFYETLTRRIGLRAK